MNLSELARGVFISQLQAMQLHLDGCIEGEDPIHLHDLRVANRRTRAALIEFKKLLPDDISQKFQDEFRWIHHMTGEVRDLDVGLSHYSVFKKEIKKNWRPYLKPLRILLEEKRLIAQEELKSILEGDRVVGILESWSTLLEEGITDRSSLSQESAREYGCLSDRGEKTQILDGVLQSSDGSGRISNPSQYLKVSPGCLGGIPGC